MNAQRIFVPFLAICLALAWGTSAAVAAINYNFESDTAAVSLIDDADPAAPMISREYWSNHVQVNNQNFGKSYIPASAAEGDNFLKIARDYPDGGVEEDPTVGMEAFLDLGGTTTAAPVRMEFMAYIPTLGVDELTTPGQMMGLAFCDDYTLAWTTSVRFFQTVDNAGAHNVMYWDGSALIDTGVTYTPDTWQQWIIDSDLDAGTSTVTVGGGVASAPQPNMGNSASYFWWTTQMGDAAFAIDDIQFSASDPVPGDLDGDGFVGAADLDIIKSFWGQTVTPGDLLSGDPSGNGVCSGDDLDIVRRDWGRGTPPTAAGVPEPGSLSLLLVGGLVLMVLRRRYRV